MSASRKHRIICTITITSKPIYFNDGIVSRDAAALLRRIAKEIECPPIASPWDTCYSAGYSGEWKGEDNLASLSITEGYVRDPNRGSKR